MQKSIRGPNDLLIDRTLSNWAIPEPHQGNRRSDDATKGGRYPGLRAANWAISGGNGFEPVELVNRRRPGASGIPAAIDYT